FANLTLVPWKENIWWVGSSYDNEFENDLPGEQFRNMAEAMLKNILKIPFTITEHFAAIRPAAMERRPFVGLHPVQSSVGILNGMGTKGCSLAPWFAKEFTEHIVHGAQINPLADVKRFKRMLSQ
ncbi:MAG TPA: FAD-dependent oxidoreductase, partial [Chitinophagaceae bacterium]|nr:FAD-dependent oxidoreductase [Chitinophagaceae bacterium]